MSIACHAGVVQTLLIEQWLTFSHPTTFVFQQVFYAD
jgi:hypothetical protein